MVVDAYSCFRDSFPDSEFIWNEDYFDGWEAIITIALKDSQVLFRVISEDEEDIKVLMAIESFEIGFARFLNRFKETAESFLEIDFDSI